MDSLTATLERRGKIQERIVKSLAHYDREQAMHLILGWFSIADLEEIAPTLSGDPEIVERT